MYIKIMRYGGNSMDIGGVYELSYQVAQADLASEVGVAPEDSFPAVLATSRMIGLMEVAAARFMKQACQPGELSVGVGVDIKHFAPTPVGEQVRVLATYEGLDGKLHAFTVEAFDRAGKVASGKHTRAIVIGDRITEGARARMEKAPA
jgi:fluoroacetyl-CoA thioesterase